MNTRNVVGIDWSVLSDYCPSLRTICFENCSFVSIPTDTSIKLALATGASASSATAGVLQVSRATTSPDQSQPQKIPSKTFGVAAHQQKTGATPPRQIFFKNLTTLRLVNPEGREMPKMLKNVVDGGKKLESFSAALALNDKSVADLFPHVPDGEKDPESSLITSFRIDSYVLTVAGLNTLLERLPRLERLFCRGSFQDSEVADLARKFGRTSLKEARFVKNTSGGLYTQESAEFMGHPGF